MKIKILPILFAIALSLALWAFWLEPSSLHSKRIEIGLNNWPVECDGLKVVVLADLHIGSPFYDLEKLAEVVKQTNQLQPDLILLAGDFVIHGVVGGEFVEPNDIASRLKILHAKLGVYAVLGNHDWWFDAKRVKQSITDVGIPLLEDKSVALAKDACRFTLVGISDYWEGAHNIDKAMENVPDQFPVLAFTHNPDIFYELPERIAITFAGHTHGGQVNLPLLGRLVVPSAYDDKFAIGHIREEGRDMFVNPGLGTSIFPVRFRVPPEISLVILKPL